MPQLLQLPKVTRRRRGTEETVGTRLPAASHLSGFRTHAPESHADPSGIRCAALVHARVFIPALMTHDDPPPPPDGSPWGAVTQGERRARRKAAVKESKR